MKIDDKKLTSGRRHTLQVRETKWQQQNGISIPLALDINGAVGLFF